MGEHELSPDQLRAELDRVEALARLHIASAVDHVRASAAAVTLDTETLDQAARDARRLGATWQQIADAAGMTRQSAWRRWRTPDEVTEP